MNYRWCTLVLGLLMTTICWAQTIHLTENDKMLLNKAAVDKVERFQTNCRYIANVNVPNAQKQNAIRTSLLDFVDGAKIVVTSLNGVQQKPKLVKTYLERLAYRMKDVYAFIDITFMDCHVASDFTPDPNEPGTYVGLVKVIQYFNAMNKESRWVNDVTVREYKIKAKPHDIIRNNKTQRLWSIKLSHIEGKAVQ